MAEKVRYKGPGGNIFVPGLLVSPKTVEKRVKAGEWTPTTEVPAPKHRPARARPAKAAAKAAAKEE